MCKKRYESIRARVLDEGRGAQLDDAVNRYNQHGWELVSVVQLWKNSHTSSSGQYDIWFKRKVAVTI